jgi:hypothetical protein
MNQPTVADIFQKGFENYARIAGKLPYDHYKAAHAIIDCRTEELGGHVYQCEACNHEKTLYNSCCNRHCPQCQALAREEWVQDRIHELLPVPYFHVVFTIPLELNPFAIRNKEPFYSILFRAVKETLLELASDKKHLGAEIGFILILHTWGQNLMDHPHIHCIVPGGGITEDGDRWKHCRETFLFPVAVMAALFKGKIMHYFRKAVETGEIKFHGTLVSLQKPDAFKLLVDSLYNKRWVVYAKQPFAGPEAMVHYLGNYTHRIAISNHRILSVQDNEVTFEWKDYADQNKQKTMTVSIYEFIRRFLLHIVPNGFMRIRHYGFLGNRCKKNKLSLCRKLLNQRIEQNQKSKEKKKWHQIILNLTGKDPRICPMCKKGLMVSIEEIPKRKDWTRDG